MYISDKVSPFHQEQKLDLDYNDKIIAIFDVVPHHI